MSASRTTAFRQIRGRGAQLRGLMAEAKAEDALRRDGWDVRARRLRTPAGEIDLVAERDGLVAIIEVKARPTLAEAAAALRPRQQVRLVAAAESALAQNPGWGANGVRFDVLLVDGTGQVKRVADAFRAEPA